MKTFSLVIIYIFFGFQTGISQFKILNQEDSVLVKNICFMVSSNKSKYSYGEKIRIQYSFQNISDSNQRIYIKNVNGFPLDMRAEVINKTTNIAGLYTKHIIISVPIKREKKYNKTIKPENRLVGEFVLEDMIILKKEFMNDEYVERIPTGEYEIRIIYNLLISNSIFVAIK